MATEIFSLLIALLAVIIGPIVSYRIAKRQLKAQIIDYSDLQDVKILDFLKIYSDIAFLVNKLKYGGITREQFNIEHAPLFTSLVLMQDKISLLIDVNNKKHVELLSKVQNSPAVLLNDGDEKWEENSIKIQGEIATLAIEIISNQKKIIEAKFL